MTNDKIVFIAQRNVVERIYEISLPNLKGFGIKHGKG